MTRCRNCGENLVKVNFVMGEEWMHQPPGSAFQDGVYRWCKTTQAEPVEDR